MGLVLFDRRGGDCFLRACLHNVNQEIGIQVLCDSICVVFGWKIRRIPSNGTTKFHHVDELIGGIII